MGYPTTEDHKSISTVHKELHSKIELQNQENGIVAPACPPTSRPRSRLELAQSWIRKLSLNAVAADHLAGYKLDMSLAGFRLPGVGRLDKVRRESAFGGGVMSGASAFSQEEQDA